MTEKGGILRRFSSVLVRCALIDSEPLNLSQYGTSEQNI